MRIGPCADTLRIPARARLRNPTTHLATACRYMSAAQELVEALSAVTVVAVTFVGPGAVAALRALAGPRDDALAQQLR